MTVGILSEEITFDNIQSELPRYITAAWKAHPSKYMISLDSPPPWNDDGRTLGETLVSELVSDKRIESFQKARKREGKFIERRVTQKELDEAYAFTLLDESGMKQQPHGVLEKLYNIIEWCKERGMYPSSRAVEKTLGFDYDESANETTIKDGIDHHREKIERMAANPEMIHNVVVSGSLSGMGRRLGGRTTGSGGNAAGKRKIEELEEKFYKEMEEEYETEDL